MTQQPQPKRIGFLGPAGTFTEEATLLYDPHATLVPFPTILASGTAISEGKTDESVLPIENSLEGAVPDTLDLLIHSKSPLHIKYEVTLPIIQCLFAKPSVTEAQIDVIYSHPQALGQCRKFIEARFPKAELIASLSTVAAVEQALGQPNAAAIAPRRAGALYGAAMLAPAIQDSANNVTRFVVLAQADHEPTDNDKTSLCFGFTKDEPGILVRVLQIFSTKGINLEKIESRPTKENLGKYIFLVDLQGHRLKSPVKEALDEVLALSDPQWFKVFGSYPRYQGSSGS